MISLNTGCIMTAVVRSDPADAPTEVYPATCTDTALIYLCFLGMANGDHNITCYFLGPALIADYPFSIVSDTLFLPYDLYKKKKLQQKNSTDGVPPPQI